MDTELPNSQPPNPETELWPLPDWIPAEAAAKFPGAEAVELLARQVAPNFETYDEARLSALGFVNQRRREMAGSEGFGLDM